MSMLMEEAVLMDILTSLFIFTLLLSISLAVRWWMMLFAFSTRLPTSPVFSLKILHSAEVTVRCRSW